MTRRVWLMGLLSVGLGLGCADDGGGDGQAGVVDARPGQPDTAVRDTGASDVRAPDAGNPELASLDCVLGLEAEGCAECVSTTCSAEAVGAFGANGLTGGGGECARWSTCARVCACDGVTCLNACRRQIDADCQSALERLEVCAGRRCAACSGTTCGDGVIDEEESCDTDKLGQDGADCSALGFGEGSLACTEACELDTSECRSPDGDGAGTCAAPVELASVAELDEGVFEVSGTTHEASAVLEGSCASGSGHERVFAWTAASDGIFGVAMMIDSDAAAPHADPLLHVRTACDDPESEIHCVDDVEDDGSGFFDGGDDELKLGHKDAYLPFRATAGTRYFIVADGFTTDDAGAFILVVRPEG